MKRRIKDLYWPQYCDKDNEGWRQNMSFNGNLDNLSASVYGHLGKEVYFCMRKEELLC